MAITEHVLKLKEGPAAWNKWRRDNPETLPWLDGADLSLIPLGAVNLSRAILAKADLTGVYLGNSDLCNANLMGATLCEANLKGAKLREALLTDANLTGAKLIGADLQGANLRCAKLVKTELKEANLQGATFADAEMRSAGLPGATLERADLEKLDLSGVVLTGTNLKKANLRGANLKGANLTGADLAGADLRGTDLNGAILAQANLGGALLKATSFGDNDLSNTSGLEGVCHEGPSIIGLNTLHRSWGRIPEAFLRGAGVPERLIDYIRAFPTRLTQYYSCFISYSTKDQDFANRLYADLQVKGVRCWLSSEDLKPGDSFRWRIETEIGIRDKLLVVVSKHSIGSR